MATVGDVFRLTINQRLFNIDIANVYYYRLLTVGTGLPVSNLFNAWNNIVLPALQDIQDTALEYVTADGLNIDSLTEFGTTTYLNTTGAVTNSDGINPFFVAKFKYFRPTRDIRNGWKAISGVAESQITDGVVDPAALAAYAAVGLALDADINANSWVFEPVIHGEPTGAPNFKPRRDYRPDGVGFVNFSTQVTRKS